MEANESIFDKTRKNLKSFNKKIDDICGTAFDATMRFFNKYQIVIMLAVMTVLALIIRYSMFEYVSGDAGSFLLGWVKHIRNEGFIGSLKVNPATYDYPISYLLFLMPFSLLPVQDLFVFKILSVLFDILMAIAGYFLAKHFTKNKMVQAVAYLALLFMPTGIVNSAVWGQCDQMYTCLILFSLLFILKGKNKTAMLILGLSFSLKIQTIFFFPALAVLWLNKKITIRQMLLMLVPVFISFIPSLLVGVELKDLVMKFLNLASKYNNSNYGAGGIYAFVTGSMEGWVTKCLNMGANMGIAIAALLFAIYMFYRRKIKMTDKNIVFVTTFFAIFTPFVMPHMHERYFYFADVMLIIYVIIFRRRYYLAFIMNFSSMLTYTHFLTFGNYMFKFLGEDCVRLAALLNAAILGFLLKDFKTLERYDDEEESSPAKLEEAVI